MLYKMLVSTADQFPDQNAIEINDSSVTYSNLRDKVDAFAHDLITVGIQHGDVVIVLLPNGLDFCVSIFAIAKIGGISVPLNTAFQTRELQYYLEDCSARAIVTIPQLVERHKELISAVNPDTKLITSVTKQNTPPPENSIPPTSICSEVLYQYSSGSTGTPKRVVRTQANLVHEANSYTSAVELSNSDRILAVVPLFHAHGFGNCLLASFRVGATMVLLESFNRHAVLDALTEKNITVFPGVPFMFSIISDSVGIEKMPLPSLRLAFTAGAPLQEKTFSAFRDKFSVPVRQLYGSSETGSVSINCGSTDGDLWSSVGKPTSDTEIKLVDDEDRQVNPECTGEIVIRSKAITSGYANLDDINRATFRDGWFWSGDIGHQDKKGNLFVTGRKKFFINAGGNKVDPAEVEAVINKHAAVKECVVLGVKGNYGEELIKAAIVLEKECTDEEIKEWCRGEIADFKVPRIIEYRDEIPRSPLGKILRKYLQNDI